MANRPKLRRGFYWRGSTVWVRTDPLDGVPRSTKCTDREAAYLWEAERQREAVNPVHAAAKRATVGDWVVRVLEIKQRQRSAGTLHMYRVKLGHVVRIFGEHATMASITAPRIDAYIEQRSSEGAVNNTISRELTCLRQMLKLAKRAGEFEADIAAVMPVGFSAGYKPVKRTLRLEDQAKLLDALRTDEERAWVCLALAIGGDRPDVEGARREDYSAARGVIHLHGTKTAQRDAEVPVLDMFRDLFDFALPRLPVSWPNVSKDLGRACKRAGIPHISPKDLRRTAGSRLMAAGADQRIVSRFLRHKNDAMVRLVYGQLTADQTGKLLDDQTRADSLQVTGGECSAAEEKELVSCGSPSRTRTGMTFRSRDFKSSDVLSAMVEGAWFGRKYGARVGSAEHGRARLRVVRHAESLQPCAAQHVGVLA